MNTIVSPYSAPSTFPSRLADVADPEDDGKMGAINPTQPSFDVCLGGRTGAKHDLCDCSGVFQRIVMLKGISNNIRLPLGLESLKHEPLAKP